MEPIDHAHQHATTRSEEEWRNRLAAGTNASQHLPLVHASAPCCAGAASQGGWCCIAFAPASVDFVMLRETKNDPPHLPIPPSAAPAVPTHPKGGTALLFILLSAACHKALSWRTVSQRCAQQCAVTTKPPLASDLRQVDATYR